MAPACVQDEKERTFKDLADHLRSVHLTIAGLCLGIILLLSGPKDQVDKAILQSNEISELMNRWPDVQTTLWQSAVNHRPSQQPLKWRDVIEATSPCSPSTLVNGKYDFSAPCAQIVAGALNVNESTLRQPDVWGSSSDGMDNKPGNLHEFRQWWNRLHSGRSIGFPDFKAIHDVQYKYESNEFGAWQAKTISFQDSLQLPLARDSRPRSTTISSDAEGPDLPISLVEDRPSGRFRISTSTKDKEGVLLTIWYEGPLYYSKIDETDLMMPAFGTLPSGDYDHAFPELSHHGLALENLDLPVAIAELGKRQSASEHTVEFLGIKISSDDITKWGLVLLLCTQAYFWIQTLALPDKCSDADPLWEVPWIALYASSPAVIATFATVVVLPVITTCFLSTQLLYSAMKIPIALAMAVVSVASSAYFSLASVYHLRRLKPGVVLPPPVAVDDEDSTAFQPS